MSRWVHPRLSPGRGGWLIVSTPTLLTRLGSPTGSCPDAVTFPQKQQSLFVSSLLFVCLFVWSLCSWLRAVLGQRPLSGCQCWAMGCVTLHPSGPRRGTASPLGKVFNPKQWLAGLRVPVAELIPKAKSFPRGWCSLPHHPGEGALWYSCCTIQVTHPPAFLLSQPSWDELSPVPGVPAVCCLTHFPWPLAPGILAASPRRPALAEKLISYQTRPA